MTEPQIPANSSPDESAPPEPSETEPSRPEITPEETRALSRRDFLRRAGKEAVDTGSKIVPGANIVRAAVGVDGKTSWWQNLARWRGKRIEEKPGDH